MKRHLRIRGAAIGRSHVIEPANRYLLCRHFLTPDLCHFPFTRKYDSHYIIIFFLRPSKRDLVQPVLRLRRWIRWNREGRFASVPSTVPARPEPTLRSADSPRNSRAARTKSADREVIKCANREVMKSADR